MTKLGEQEMSTKFEQRKSSSLGFECLCILNGHYVFQEIGLKRKHFC